MPVEPPDRLTERVWQMLAAARTSSMTPAEVIEQLTASLRRNLRYLVRREQQGHQMSYDEVLQQIWRPSRGWSSWWSPLPMQRTMGVRRETGKAYGRSPQMISEYRRVR